MFNFGKTKEELKVCKAALEKRLEELRRTCDREVELQRKLDVLQIRFSNSQAEVGTYITASTAARSEAEAYKTDNLTPISRVAQLQEELATSRQRFDALAAEHENLQNTVQELLEAVQKAQAKRAAKKKKGGKKKRK